MRGVVLIKPSFVSAVSWDSHSLVSSQGHANLEWMRRRELESKESVMVGRLLGGGVKGVWERILETGQDLELGESVLSVGNWEGPPLW